MEPTSGKLPQEKTHPKAAKTGGPPPAELKRTLDAPIERVWKAWTDAELVKQWWGPEGYRCPEAKLDFRVGGKYLYAMKGPGGEVIWGGGEFREIENHRKITYSDRFTDPKGNPVSAREYGMPGEWPMTTTVTVTFGRVGDRTEMSLTHEGIPPEMHDDCVAGWASTIDKMQKLVERN